MRAACIKLTTGCYTEVGSYPLASIYNLYMVAALMPLLDISLRSSRLDCLSSIAKLERPRSASPFVVMITNLLSVHTFVELVVASNRCYAAVCYGLTSMGSARNTYEESSDPRCQTLRINDALNTPRYFEIAPIATSMYSVID